MVFIVYGAHACPPLKRANLRYKSFGQLLLFFFWFFFLYMHDFVFHFLSLLSTIAEQFDEKKSKRRIFVLSPCGVACFTQSDTDGRRSDRRAEVNQ